ncbi:MAG TPA: hypothetical protein VE398_20760 [Acidobacteriota bacterium]|nr:hypothetical protein [Acidobacteriota bacterium]
MAAIELNAQPPPREQKAARWPVGDRVLWLALGLGVAACLAIYFHIPYVNGPKGPKQWQWPYMHRDVFLQSLLGGAWRLGLGGMLLGGGAWALRRRMQPGAVRRWGGLIVLFCWGLFFVWTSLIAATPMRLAHLPRIVKSQTWTSYFTLARWIESGRRPPLGETLQRYAELIPDLPLHASTHPPGPLVCSYAILRFFQNHPGLSSAMGDLYRRLGTDPALLGTETIDSADVAAMSIGTLVIVLGQLGMFPLFWLVRDAMRKTAEPGGEVEADRTAWAAAALWVHYPALVLMAPAFDLIYPTAALLCIYFAARGLSGNPIAWGAALGLAFMASLTLVFTLLFLVPMLCLMAWLELSRRAGSLKVGSVLQEASLANPGGRRLWILASVTAVVCFIVEAILRHVFGIHLMQIFFAAVRNQNEILLPRLNRTYKVWVFYNVWDFLLFAGMPLAVLAISWLARAFREWWRTPGAIVPAIAVFPIAILAIDLSHQLSAETARVWLFLAPCLAWAGAAELVRRFGKHWCWALVGLLLVQTVFIYLCRTNMMLWGF